MIKKVKTNTITWLLLVILIIASTIFAENDLKSAYILITAFASVKFLLVLFRFVEVEQAHIAWKIVSFLFVAIYFVGVLVLYK